MESGFVSPILDTTDLPIEYIDLGWIIGLQNRLRSFNAGIWIEDAWVPPLLQISDLLLQKSPIQNGEKFFRI